MKFSMIMNRIALITAILSIVAGCSSDDDNKQKVQNKDAGVFQGYRDAMDKAENVEQTLLQADKARRAKIDANN
jgi:PBP1b-binding outer membrane lipoprotein LpoB